MAVSTVVALRKILFDAYDGFGDKRLKDLKRDAPFIVDDRGGGDHDAQGKLFLWFCSMSARVEAPDRVRLSLRGGAPKAKLSPAGLRRTEPKKRITALKSF